MAKGIKFNPQHVLNLSLLIPLSTELVELKIEEFLVSFGEKLNALTEEAFNTQVCVCVTLRICEASAVMKTTQQRFQKSE